MPDDLFVKKPTTIDRARLVSRGGEWLFAASVIIFILVFLAWGGLFFFRRSLKTNAANWQEQVTTLENELRPELLNQLISLSRRLSSARDIVVNHTFTSNVFSLLEKNTHPRVSFTNFNFAGDSRKIDLSAIAASYRTVAEQVAVFEGDPQVESVNFGGLSLDEKGLVNFKLSIIAKPSLLRLRPQQ